jgi:hypothetical protein
MPVKKPIKKQGRNKTSKTKPQNGDISSFESPWFWINLAAIDFCKFFGVESATHEEEPINTENN